MNSKLLLFAALATIAVITAVVLPIALIPDRNRNQSYPLVTFSWSAKEATVAQGGTVSVNCTVFNTDYNISTNAGLGTYASSFNNSWVSWNGSTALKIYNATFSPKVLYSLGPQESRTAVLCINFADDAPVGNYTFPLQGFNNTLQVTVLPKRGS